MRTGKPTVVFLMNSMPPYRASVCRRLRDELQLDLISAVTHDPLEGTRWPPVPQADLRQVFFAPNQSVGPASARQHLSDLGKAFRVVRWLMRVRPAAVLVYGYDDFSRLLTVLWGRLAGVPMFVAGDSNIHGESRRRLVRLVKSAYLRPLFRMLNGAMPHGSFGTRYFRKYGVPAARIYKLPLEPDYDRIAGITASEVNVLAERLKLSAGRRRIVYSGRFVAVKRVDLLIAAFSRVADQRPEWDLILLGAGPLEEELRRSVPPTLNDRVYFIPAMRDPADVFTIYRLCDVLVLPSDYEPWAIVINEAAASGLALVCSNVVGAAADLLRDGVNGRSFRKGDVGDLTAALIHVTDPANLDRYKAGSRQAIADWRRDVDPVRGVEAALRDVGVLPN